MKSSITLTKIVLVSGLILTTLAAVSGTLPVASSSSVTTESARTIQHYFKFPQVLLNPATDRPARSSKVEVLFTTAKDGSVNFVMAKTQDEELKKEIEKQFSGLNFGNLSHNVVHSVVLNFKTL